MDVKRQQSGNVPANKSKRVPLIQSDPFNYSNASDTVSDPEVGEIIDDKISRSKRGIKIPKIKGKKGKKSSSKPRLLDRLNTKKNREKARDGLEEFIDDDEPPTTEMPEELRNNLGLIKSVKQSNLDKVTEYVNKGADINTKDIHGQTSLHIASKRGYSDIAKFLMDKGADIYAQESKFGQESLHLAAARGHLDIVEYLVDKGADVDAYQGGGGYSTALHFAARKGHFDIVKFLIEKGANPDAKDGDGKTAMERAAQKGIPDIVEYLIERMKQVTETTQIIEVTTEDATNITQTTEGQNTTERHLVATSITQTAEMQNVTENIATTTDGWDGLIHAIALDKLNNERKLRAAAREGELNAVKNIVESGIENEWYDIDINATDEYGLTPLHFAVRHERLDVVKYLIEKGADINLRDGGYKGDTPLHEAVESGSLDIVKYLIQNGADINATNKDMDTPLHYAANQGKLDIAKYLIDKRASLRAENTYGSTPLHEAARATNLGIVKYIVDKKYDYSTRADINAENKYGETPLHIAVRKGSLSIVKYLVENHAYTSVPDGDGNTPLHLAAKSSSSIGLYLIEQGANLEAKNKNGQTPIEYGTRYGSRYRRDISSNSMMNNSVIYRLKESIASRESPSSITSGDYSNQITPSVPEINANVVNNAIMLGIVAAGFFNKTQSNHTIPEYLLSPRERVMRNIDNSSRILGQSLRKGKEEGWDIPGIEEVGIDFNGN